MRDQEQTAISRVRKWILGNAEANPGFTSVAVATHTDTTMPMACNALREMVEEGILTRKRHKRTFEYYAAEMHDVEEYLHDKHAQLLLSKKYSSYVSANNRLKKTVNELEELAKQNKLHVSCECGRRFLVKIQLEEIPLYDSS
jgi:3-hydroxyacyl-CoA dehydrogenase